MPGPAAAALAVMACALAIDDTARAEPAVTGLLDARTVRAELTGRELAGIYPSGMHWREFVASDGTSAYVERGEKRSGRWWLAGPRFCFHYARPGSGGCFRVTRSSPNCYDLYFVGRADVPSTRPEGDAPGDEAPTRADWNGIMWRTGEASTCDVPSV
jgi:hypothetical protein